jgi:hypothetical protein
MKPPRARLVEHVVVALPLGGRHEAGALQQVGVDARAAHRAGGAEVELDVLAEPFNWGVGVGVEAFAAGCQRLCLSRMQPLCPPAGGLQPPPPLYAARAPRAPRTARSCCCARSWRCQRPPAAGWTRARAAPRSRARRRPRPPPLPPPRPACSPAGAGRGRRPVQIRGRPVQIRGVQQRRAGRRQQRALCGLVRPPAAPQAARSGVGRSVTRHPAPASPVTALSPGDPPRGTPGTS